MSEEEFTQTIKDSGVLNPYLKGMPSIPHTVLDSTEAMERWKRDSEAIENGNFRLAVYECSNDIISEETNIRGSFSSRLFMVPEAYKKSFSGQSSAQLQSTVEEIRSEKGKANTAKINISKLISADMKTQWEKNRMVTRESSNRSYSWSVYEWNGHETKIKGKIAVLDLFMLYCDQIIDVFDSEIAERMKSPKIKGIIKEMTAIAKKGEKLKPTIVQSNEKAQKTLLLNGRPDLKTCKVYINAKTEFDDLSYQHYNLMTQLAFYTNENQNAPSFPGLNCTETTAETAIKEEWRRLS